MALGASIALMLAVGALVLTQAPPRVVRAAPRANTVLSLTARDLAACQKGEALPAGVSAIRLSLGAAGIGGRVHVQAISGSQVLTEGEHGPGWTGNSVTVPVAPRDRSTARVKLCFDIAPNSEPILIAGRPSLRRQETAVTVGGVSLGGRLSVEYLAAGSGSWWSRALTVARHMGLGHALSGTWVVLLIAALMTGAGLLAVWLALRESAGNAPGTRRPRRRLSAAWTCALIAFLSASAWALIMPPFQGRDEVDHFAYVEQLAENGSLPENGHEIGTYSPAETLVLQGLDYAQVVFSPQRPAISSVAQQQTLMEDVQAGASLQGSGEAGIATSEPPLFYALQTIPYAVGHGNILVQLQLMRLLGAIFGAATALLTFLFLRELMPGSPWAATVGGLCVALQPLLSFISGSVNPEAMLYTVAAAIFLCLARGFRRGLTPRLAVALGILIAVGFLTKLNFVGFACGVFVGLLVFAVRGVKSRGAAALLAPAIAALIGVLPVLFYALRNLLGGHPVFGIVSGSAGQLEGSISDELSYIWQMYLPRLPGMPHYFAGLATYKDIWFDRSVGFYGWMDTMFPGWVANIALVPAAAVALLCGRELFVRRATLRARLPELAVYGAMVAGVLVMIGASSYISDALEHKDAFGEPRYLLPLVPLLGAVVALAVRGAGRRWAPVVGAAIVVLFFGHDLFSQLQVIARYYG